MAALKCDRDCGNVYLNLISLTIEKTVRFYLKKGKKKEKRLTQTAVTCFSLHRRNSPSSWPFLNNLLRPEISRSLLIMIFFLIYNIRNIIYTYRNTYICDVWILLVDKHVRFDRSESETGDEKGIPPVANGCRHIYDDIGDLKFVPI